MLNTFEAYENNIAYLRRELDSIRGTINAQQANYAARVIAAFEDCKPNKGSSHRCVGELSCRQGLFHIQRVNVGTVGMSFSGTLEKVSGESSTSFHLSELVDYFPAKEIDKLLSIFKASQRHRKNTDESSPTIESHGNEHINHSRELGL